MANEGNTHGFKKGGDSNRTSAGSRKKRRPRSELRVPLKKFQEDFEEAYSVIKDSLTGKDVEKERLQTAKYMIDKMITLNSQAIADEMKKVQIRKQLDDGSEEILEVESEDEDRPKASVFSLVMPKKD